MSIKFNPKKKRKKEEDYLPIDLYMTENESRAIEEMSSNREFEMNALKVEDNKLIFLNEEKNTITDCYEYSSHEEAVNNFNALVELLELTIPFKNILYAK
jgi:hypothetical protein